MVHSNQKILMSFFNSIIRIVSGGTSDLYAVMVMQKFIKNNIATFPFVRHIHLRLGKIDINQKINTADRKIIGKFLTKLINSLFSDLFKHLMKRKINVELFEDLKSMGVKI